MNQRIDFSFNGGFPATQYMTDYMQTSYRGAFIALAGLIGDKVIVSGCQIVGDTITNGWIAVNGELVPFVGGAGDSTSPIAIVQSTEDRLFQDDNSHTVYYKRQAVISSPGTFLYSDLKNIGTLKDMMPTGLISMWSGAVDAVPVGWALCDGTNGTPNLKGKFIVGYDPDDEDYNAIGNGGGEKRHTLLTNEMPSHSHAIDRGDAYTGNSQESDMIVGGGQGTSRQSSPNTETAGTNTPHENRPPFYTLAYIIKL